MNLFYDIMSLKWLGDGSKKEAIWLWLALSVWLPYVLSGVIMFLVFLVIMLDDESRRIALSQKRMFALGAAISVLSFVSALISLNYIGLCIAFGVLVVITSGCYLRATADRVIFNKSTVVLAAGSVAGFIAALVQGEILKPGEPDYRPPAGAFNPNYYGNLIVFALIVCAVRFFEKKEENGEPFLWHQPPRWIWAVVGALDVAALFYSRSRSSLMALMACALVYLVLSRHIWITLLCGAAFCGVWAIGYFNPDIFNWSNTLNNVFDGRVDIWKDTIEYFLRTPRNFLIGNGPMTYFHVFEEAGLCSAMHGHNIVFDTLINVGVIGLLLYTLLIFEILRAAWENFRAKGKEWILSLVIVAEIMVQGIADVTIMWLQTSVMFILLVFPAKAKSDAVRQNGEAPDGASRVTE